MPYLFSTNRYEILTKEEEIKDCTSFFAHFVLFLPLGIKYYFYISREGRVACIKDIQREKLELMCNIGESLDNQFKDVMVRGKSFY